MKQLSQKDYVVAALFFLLVLATSSYAVPAMILKEVSYQPLLAQNPFIYAFAFLGYLLTLPILLLCLIPIYFVQLIGGNVAFDSLYSLIPFLTALLYSFFVVLLLAMYRERSGKSK